MAMVGVVSGSLYRRTHSLSRLAWSWVGGRCGAILHSSNEPGELSQWLCHDDRTIDIVLVIIIIIRPVAVLAKTLWGACPPPRPQPRTTTETDPSPTNSSSSGLWSKNVETCVCYFLTEIMHFEPSEGFQLSSKFELELEKCQQNNVCWWLSGKMHKFKWAIHCGSKLTNSTQKFLRSCYQYGTSIPRSKMNLGVIDLPNQLNWFGIFRFRTIDLRKLKPVWRIWANRFGDRFIRTNQDGGWWSRTPTQ